MNEDLEKFETRIQQIEKYIIEIQKLIPAIRVVVDKEVKVIESNMERFDSIEKKFIEINDYADSTVKLLTTHHNKINEISDKLEIQDEIIKRLNSCDKTATKK